MNCRIRQPSPETRTQPLNGTFGPVATTVQNHHTCGVATVVEHRILLSVTDADASLPTDERPARNLDGALILLTSTGSGEEGQLALSTLTLLRIDRHPLSHSGRIPPS